VKTALFNLGFRPFFLAAGIFAALSMTLWLAIYTHGTTLELQGIGPSQWHAHEMIYGYALAVIAGFLLTATRNWTNMPTPSGKPLAAMFACWLVARALWLFGTRLIEAAAVFDLLFVVWLSIACALPNIRARQWRQMAVLTKLMLLGAGNALFYAGALGLIAEGVHWSLYGGIYLVIALIMTMGRRLIPFFTERGVTPAVTLRNSRALDLSSLALFLGFFIAEVFLLRRELAAVACVGLFVVNTPRLAFWYTRGILTRPLLWGLFLSFAIIDAGFLLYSAGVWWNLSPFLALHAFAIGGIGMMTLAMMMRVSLGHTGRSVHQPPAVIRYPLALLALAVLLRIILPLMAPADYLLSVVLAGTSWIGAFAWFAAIYLPILSRPRLDGAPG